MINIGLESVIDKAKVQGDSVSFKVKLYDENLSSCNCWKKDIVVTLSTSLIDIEESSFLEIPLLQLLLLLENRKF